MRRLIALSLVASLAACGTTAKNDIAASEATLTTLEAAAFQYNKLPICGTAGVTVCKTIAIEKKLGDADNVAYIAIKAAEAAAANNQSSSSAISQAVAAAGAALTAFQQIVLALPVGAKP